MRNIKYYWCNLNNLERVPDPPDPPVVDPPPEEDPPEEIEGP